MKLSTEDQEFVKNYDDSKYAKPSVTADMVIFARSREAGHEHLEVLLIQRGRPPFRGQYALPGGFVNPDESVDDAAWRELEEETGVDCGCLEQLRTFSTPGRDPRRWVITCAYLALVEKSEITVQAGDDAKAAEWFSVKLERQTDAAVSGETDENNGNSGSSRSCEKSGMNENSGNNKNCGSGRNKEKNESRWNGENSRSGEKNKNSRNGENSENNGNRKKEEPQKVCRWALVLCGKQETIRIPFCEEHLPGQMEPRFYLEKDENGLAFDHGLILAYAAMRLFKAGPSTRISAAPVLSIRTSEKHPARPGTNS